jgi:predicted Zn-dependent peptidase
LLDEGSAGCDRVCLAQRLRELGAVVKLVDDPRIPMDDYYTNGRFSFIRIETTAAYGLEMLDLLTDLIQHGAFEGADLDRVRRERITDLEQASVSARREADRLLDEALYGDHPLVLPPEGTVETLEALDFNELRLVYRRAFSPENLIFSIVGPYSHEELSGRIEQLLVGRGKPAPGLPVLPVTGQARSITGSAGGEIAALRHGSVFAVEPGDAHALRLLVAILSDRMAMDLRETRGLSYSVGATVGVHGGIGQFVAWLNPPRERMDEGRTALAEFITTFDATTITQEELDRIRSARLGRTMMRRISSMGQAYYLAMAELDDDIPGYLEAFTAPHEVQLTDLVAAAGKYLTPMKRIEVVVD